MNDEELTDRFRVVFMCTGNQARSVIAEHYLRKITEGLPVDVESCGTMDIPSSPALPEAVAAGQALGLDLGGHGSRCYTAVDLTQMDLVIGFDQNHIATAVVDGRATPQKTFKLLELVRLLDQTVPPTGGQSMVDRAREIVSSAASQRTGATSFTPGENLDDPAGKKPAFFTETASSIQRALDVVRGSLFTGAPPGATGRDDDLGTSTSARIWD
jgi:protein-tyrosine-phosphatase